MPSSSVGRKCLVNATSAHIETVAATAARLAMEGRALIPLSALPEQKRIEVNALHLIVMCAGKAVS